MAVDALIVITDINKRSATVAFYFDVTAPIPQADDDLREPQLLGSLSASDLTELKAGTSHEVVQTIDILPTETKAQFATRLTLHRLALDVFAQKEYQTRYKIKSYIGTKLTISGGWI